MLREPQTTLVRDRAVTVELRPSEAEVEQGLATLDQARAMVTVDRDVLGGTPCIGGTRVPPVHDIAEMLANGDGKAATLAALAAAHRGSASSWRRSMPRPIRAAAGRAAHPGGRRRRKSSRSLRLDELPSAS
ncbi:MAG: DUF433 domain-containing protein [Rhodospirillales bacterium]|nr:DUF433 domain-containing protein [Rhodospirillales bacterium]